jgi:hypothetical protein
MKELEDSPFQTGKRKGEAMLRKHLKELVGVCEEAIKELDKALKGQNTYERGKKLAAIVNFLEINKDRAKHFGLKDSLRKQNGNKN